MEPRDRSEPEEPKRQSVFDFVTPEDDPVEDVESVGEPASRSAGLPFGVTRQHLLASVIVFLMLLGALAIGLGIYSSSKQNRVYDGVSVAGVDLSGKTRSQARAALDPVLREYLVQPITLSTESDDFTIDPATSGIGFDVDASVERAFAYGRDGNLFTRFANWSRALLHGADLDPVVVIDTPTLNSALTSVAENVIIPPVNAAIVIAGEAGPAIATEWPGVGFDLTATRHLIAQHVESLSDDSVPMVLTELEPEIERADLEMGLATAQVVVTDGFVIRGPDRRIWRLDRDDLRSLIAFGSEDGSLSINTEAIEDLVATLSEGIDQEAVNATVFVNDDEEVVVRRSVDARLVDQEASVESVLSALLSGAGEATLTVAETPAVIQTETAQATADRIEAIVDDGIELSWGDGSEQLSRRELLAALTIEIDPDADEPFELGLDQTVLSSVIAPIVEPLETSVQNAEFRMVDGAITVTRESRVGISVDVPATVAATRQAALAGADSVDVLLTRTEPEVSESDAGSIRMTDVLATGSTSLIAASDARKSNIAQAGQVIDGVMVAPGGTFSFLDSLGDVSESDGYEIAYGVIYDSANGASLGPIMGGGVSQVVTTLFQAAFWSGLPIEERTGHPWWIEAYGQPPSGMIGLDAIVDVRSGGEIDFTFENSTGNWIVISIEVTGTAVNVSINGTNPGWTVRADEPVITDREAVEDDASEVEIETPELPDGTERTIESATEGFSVTIERTVIQGETTVSEDDFVSVYEPSPGVILVGSGEAADDD